MRSKYNACHRAYKIAYEDMIRPVRDSEALTFGTAMHACLEIYWGSNFDVDATFAKTSEKAEKLSFDMNDSYIGHTLMALVEGYVNAYVVSDREAFRQIAAEVGFEVPLMNPDTGAASKTFALAGKIDAIAEDMIGRKIIIEHKTTSCDIGPGSDYWKKLPIDGQVSGYYVGASSVGHEVQNCLYDVIRRPSIKPMKATPAEQRKYTKDGKLYASQREYDESPTDWYLRLSEDIASRPEYYFARMNVARSENDLMEYLYDMWSLSKELIEARKNDRWSRNPNACSVYGTCEYFDVCTGCASLSDTTLFKVIDDPNPELK